MARHYSMILTLALLAGCSSMGATENTSGVTLRVEPSTAAAGANVQLILDNDSGGQVGYNLCTSALERIVNDTAQAVPSDRICTMELRILESGQDARYTLPLPAPLSPGEYRAVARVERMTSGEMIGVTSNTFRVGS